MAKYFDVVVFPANSKKAKIRRLKVPVFIVWFVCLLTPLFIASSAYVMWHYSANTLSCQRFKVRTGVYREQLAVLEKKVKGLQTQMSKVKDLDDKLRVIANLKPSLQKGESAWGIGGISDDAVLPGEVANTLAPEEAERIRQLHYDLFRVERLSKFEEKSLGELHKVLAGRKNLLDSTPSIRPVYGYETSGFGFRISPFTGHKQFHEGLDIANRKGTPVIAPANGLVVFAGRRGGFGNLVIVDHGHGITTRFGHLSRILVKTGRHVKRGDRIAEIGNTGRSTGPHLHYEVRLNGVPVNPKRYILN